MAGDDKRESVFEFKMGPAFLAVIVSILLSGAQFFYTQGQQSGLYENTKKTTEKLEKSDERQSNRQNSLTERIVKVETIVSTVQSSIAEMNSKLDHIIQSVRVDKK